MNNTLVLGKPVKGSTLWAINHTLELLSNSWIFIPAVFFYREVAQNMANIPIIDDFYMPLNFVMKFSQAGLWDKLGLIFGQYAEHRLVPSKLLYLCYYYLTGEINFRALGIIGDLQLLGVAFIGVYFIKKFMSESWKLPAFIWVLLVFDLNTYENGCMCMNAVGNYGVICYFFAALYFYDKGNKWIPLAVLFQFFCIFSNANGLAAGVIIAIFNVAKPRRQMIISSVTSGILIGLYFIHFHTVDLPNKLPFHINIPVTFFIRQSGAHFSFDNSYVIGIFVLIPLVLMFPWRRLFDAEFTPVLCIFLFVLATMVLAAIFRSCYSDAQFQTSRYLIYPQLMLGSLCIFIWMKLKSTSQRRVGGSVILVVMLLAYAGNYRFGKLGFERTNYRAMVRKFWHPDPAAVEKVCKEACAQGIYCIDDNR